MFKRWIDLQGRKSTLLLGPRRSGKTTLLKRRYPDYTYATLDDLDHLDWARRDPKGFVQSLGTKAVVDEIQRHPPLTIAIKYAIDEENAHFIMTGSSSVGLLDASADSLAGRIQIRSLPTACWGEDKGKPTHRIFQDHAPFPQLKAAGRILDQALTYGQFPEVVTAASQAEKADILRNYRNTYFTRDLMMIANIENLDGLLALYHHLARSVGSLLETSNFAREAGISFVTAKKYLNSLIQSHLTFKLTGYQYGPAKRHVKAAKTYLADNGIIQSFGARLSRGQLMENFVISELEKRRKLGFIHADQLHYYRTAGGREIDLIIETPEQVLAIEVKATHQPSGRDLQNLKAFETTRKKSLRRILFYTGTEYDRTDTVELIPIAALYRGS